MAQILDPIPNEHRNSILCCYVNVTNHIQIARITNVANWYFERVVFPGQRLVFEAVSEAMLEIHSGLMASAILSDIIPCDRLCISSDSNDDVKDNASLSSVRADRKHSINANDNKNQESIISLQAVLVSAS